MTFLEWWQSDKASLVLAGLAGSAVSAAMEWTGVLPAVRKIVVGTLSAIYLSPLSTPFLGWVLDGISVQPENAPSMSGFLMGVVGIVVIEIILKAFKLRRDNLENGGNSQPITPPPPTSVAPGQEGGE